MTRECDIYSEDLPAPDLVSVGNGQACSECHGALFVDGPTDTDRTEFTDSRSPALEAFADAVEFLHEQLDRHIDDHQSGERADRPATGRAYLECVRGWDADTVDAKRLGWAPADETALLDYLMGEGYDRGAILGTGPLTENLTPLWQGRYVFPYFDVDGRPVYAISRSTGAEGGGAAGYDGYLVDFMDVKYAKPAHTKEHVAVDEPTYGLETVKPGEAVPAVYFWSRPTGRDTASASVGIIPELNNILDQPDRWAGVDGVDGQENINHLIVSEPRVFPECEQIQQALCGDDPRPVSVL